MLDWLKTILGEGYNDEIDSKISAAIGQHIFQKIPKEWKKDQRSAAICQLIVL